MSDRLAFNQGQLLTPSLICAGEVLEYAVLLTVKKEDEAGFERQFLQLKPYYVDTR
jgi:26S proteasome regulatory subunit N12